MDMRVGPVTYRNWEPCIMFIICVPLGNHITLCTVGMQVGAQNIISFLPSFYALYSSKIPNSRRLRSEGNE
jgi:hypothetical protein